MGKLILIAIVSICGEPETGVFYAPESGTRVIAPLNQGERYELAHAAMQQNPQLNIKVEDLTSGLHCS